MPDGRIIRGVPEGTTQRELSMRLAKFDEMSGQSAPAPEAPAEAPRIADNVVIEDSLELEPTIDKRAGLIQRKTLPTPQGAPSLLGKDFPPSLPMMTANRQNVKQPLDLKGISGKNADERRAQLEHLLGIGDLEKDFGIPAGLLSAQITAESGWNPKAVGPLTKYGTAKGLSQLLDSTAKELGVTDPFDPVQAVRGQAIYMAKMLKKFGGDKELAIAAYHAGPGNLDKLVAEAKKKGVTTKAALRNAPWPKTKNYVAKILNNMGKSRANR